MARRTYVRDRRGRFATVGATARGGRLTRESGSRYATEKKAIAGGKRAGTIGKSPKAKPAPKPAVAKVDLSQAAFERRAASAEKRARAAEQRVAGADRGYASATTRRQFQTADALRAAADSYRSIARRGKSGDFSAAQVFGKRARYSTAPTLSRSEKAAATRRANAAKRTQEQIRKMEQARRWGR
jgi:hypothetical protein